MGGYSTCDRPTVGYPDLLPPVYVRTCGFAPAWL